jgi:hypothetical protein
MDVSSWRDFLARRSPGLLLGGICLVAAVGCGGSDDGTTSATETTTAATSATSTKTTQPCEDVAALRASIENLDNLDLPNTGKAGLQSALQEIRTRLDALKASAGDQWATQVDELDAAITAFQDTVAAVQGDNLLTSIPTIVSNLERIDDAWRSLQDQIDEACPMS